VVWSIEPVRSRAYVRDVERIAAKDVIVVRRRRGATALTAQIDRRAARA
jgi:hypothetical protein